MSFSNPADRFPEIVIPNEKLPGGEWRCTLPFLKLALKYGLVGPWTPDGLSDFNLSVSFDGYSATRGPKQGMPDLGDLCATLLMNSNVRRDDIPRFLHWLRQDDIVADLKQIRDDLSTSEGLHVLSSEAISRLGLFIDKAINDDERLSNFRTAKVFKWLSAWAPAHVPMVDSLVKKALIETGTLSNPDSATELLLKFREILIANLEPLQLVGAKLVSDFPQHFPAPIPPVRLLDNLIWFDWQEDYWEEFAGYIVILFDPIRFEAAPAGAEFLAIHGFAADFQSPLPGGKSLMPLNHEEALAKIIDVARQHGKDVAPGATTEGAHGKLFEDEVHVSADKLDLWINTLDGKQGYGVSMSNSRNVVSFGRKELPGEQAESGDLESQDLATDY